MIRYPLTLLAVVAFLYTLIVTISPTKPGRLPKRYQVCDVNNINSWQISTYGLKKIESAKDQATEEKYIQFTYEDSIPKAYIYLQCKTFIPVDTLYKAIVLKTDVKINQPATLGSTIERVGQGPALGDVFVKSEDINQPFTITKLLDTQPKLTWLSGNYDIGVLSVIPTNFEKPLIITVYGIYLE